MTTADTADVPDNMVLSNRDKAQHSDVRGLDGRVVQTEQMRDHVSNRRIEPTELEVDLAADELGDDTESLDRGAAS
jgi:hypothetical protein